MTEPTSLAYHPLDGRHALDGHVWHAGAAEDLGTRLDFPASMLGGPVGAFLDGEVVAVATRSVDFPPYAVMVREDFSSLAAGEQPGVRIQHTDGMWIRTESSPARTSFMGMLTKPDSDLLILEAPTGSLVRLA